MWGKFIICPFDAIAEKVPRRGRILDIGCGHGLFANLLALGSPERSVTGVDLSEKKIEMACRSVGARGNVRFFVADALEADLEGARAITLIDVLYLIPYEKQMEILRTCAAALPPGGLLLFRTLDKRPAWKFAVSLVREKLSIHVFKMTLGAELYYRASEEWMDLLANLGFRVEIDRQFSGLFSPSVLFTCRKRSG